MLATSSSFSFSLELESKSSHCQLHSSLLELPLVWRRGHSTFICPSFFALIANNGLHLFVSFVRVLEFLEVSSSLLKSSEHITNRFIQLHLKKFKIMDKHDNILFFHLTYSFTYNLKNMSNIFSITTWWNFIKFTFIHSTIQWVLHPKKFSFYQNHHIHFHFWESQALQPF